MSNQQGRAPFISAWGMKRRYYSDHLSVVRTPEVATPAEIHSIWIDWWMTPVTTGTANTKSLNDSLTGGPGASHVIRGDWPTES